MLKINNINKKYKNAENKALSNISYQFSDKGLYVLTGPSGAGKTTLLGILAGVDEEYEGKVIYNDIILNKKNIISYRNNISTIVFQDLNLISSLNVENNLRIAYEIAGVEYSKEKLIQDLKKVNLPDNESIDHFLNKSIKELSGGQKQRIAILRALIRKSKIILLDEPTAALDEKNAKEITKLLKEMSKDILIIVATHSPSFFGFEETKTLHIDNGILFENNTNIKIENIKEETSFGKEKGISLFNSFKLASSFFSRSKFKLFGCLSLCFISLTSFSYFSNIKAIDSNETLLRTQISKGNNLALMTNSYSYINSETNETVYENSFTKKQQEILKQEGAHELFDFNIHISNTESINDENYLSLSFIEYSKYSLQVMELWDENEFDGSFIQDERIKDNEYAQFPSEVHQVAISSYLADFLLKYGGTIYEGNDPNDLIRKKIGKYFYICNIYSTKDEIETKDFWTTKRNQEDSKFKELEKMISLPSYCQYLYACPSFSKIYEELFDVNDNNSEKNTVDQGSDDQDDDIDDYVDDEPSYDDEIIEFKPRKYKYYIYNCEGNVNKALSLRNKLLSVKEDDIDKTYEEVSFDNIYSYRYSLGYMVKESEVQTLFFWFIILMVVISLIGLLLLFSANLKKETFTYGILNALGCSKKGLIQTQIIETSFIGIILAILVTITTQIGCHCLNNASRLICLTFNPIVFIETLGLIIGITLITSIFSYIKAIKTNPKILLSDKD